MAYTLEITRHNLSAYSETDEWLDGDTREIDAASTETVTYDPKYHADEFGSPVEWALYEIRRTDAHEPSSSPVTGATHEWLSGTYDHPYDNTFTETTIRLVGDWTTVERMTVLNNA